MHFGAAGVFDFVNLEGSWLFALRIVMAEWLVMIFDNSDEASGVARLIKGEATSKGRQAEQEPQSHSEWDSPSNLSTTQSQARCDEWVGRSPCCRENNWASEAKMM
jgi:hypothetical protein